MAAKTKSDEFSHDNKTDKTELVEYLILEGEKRSAEMTKMWDVLTDVLAKITEPKAANLSPGDSNEILYELREIEKRGITVKMEQPRLDNGSIDPDIDRNFSYLFSSYVYFQEDPVTVHAINR